MDFLIGIVVAAAIYGLYRYFEKKADERVKPTPRTPEGTGPKGQGDKDGK